MNETLRQFNSELGSELKAKFQSPEFASVLKAITKDAADDRSFEVVMSTADEDRQGDALDQSKWDLKYFEMNPVLLWSHNYGGFPIGVVEDIRIEGDQAIATGKFAPEGMNPEADMACALYQQKILRAVSPGYIQKDDGTRELLELSFCSVPAGRYALSMRQVRAIGCSTQELVAKGFFYDTKGAVPFKDHGNADPDEAWDGPAEVKACGDDLTKLKAICAWFDSEDADVKSAYKLPHHRASDLKAVLKGVEAAAAAVNGARGGVDIPEKDLATVRAHLSKHYKSFGKEPPWEKKAEEIGDKCELDDGTPGVLAEDPKNPGRLVCVPSDGGKSKSNETQSNNVDELEKKLKAEHERHGEAVMKHIEEFTEKAVGEHEEPDGDEKKAREDGDESREGSDNSEMEKAIQEFSEKMDDEHDIHHENCMKAIDDHAYDIDPEEKKAHEKEIDEFRKAVEKENLEHAKAMDGHTDEMHKKLKDAADGDPEGIETAQRKAIQEFTEKAEDELDRHEKAHMKLMKEAFGEGEEDETKSIQKAGRAISSKNKEKLKAICDAIEAHHGDVEKAIEEFKSEHRKHTDDVIAAVKELIGSEDGDEGKEGEDGKKSRTPNSRSSTSGAAEKNLSELDAYLLTQRLARKLKTDSEEILRQIKKEIKTRYQS